MSARAFLHYLNFNISRPVLDSELRWPEVTLHLVDAPLVHSPWEQRMDHLKKLILEHNEAHAKIGNVLPPAIVLVDHVMCEGPEHLRAFMAESISKGHPGVMLRKPQTPYTRKRSTVLVEVKVSKSLIRVADKKKEGEVLVCA